jgi:hypothetical protein
MCLFGHDTAPPQPLDQNGQRDARRDRCRRGAGLQQEAGRQNASANQVLPGHFHIIPAIKAIKTNILDKTGGGMMSSLT